MKIDNLESPLVQNVLTMKYQLSRACPIVVPYNIVKVPNTIRLYDDEAR